MEEERDGEGKQGWRGETGAEENGEGYEFAVCRCRECMSPALLYARVEGVGGERGNRRGGEYRVV